jgi:hypothetical protein
MMNGLPYQGHGLQASKIRSKTIEALENPGGPAKIVNKVVKITAAE